jgi:preprotein translocase subunit SecG
MGFLFYLTPIVAVIFFVNCVALSKKIQKGDENTANHTGWGALMFGYLVFSIMLFTTVS